MRPLQKPASRTEFEQVLQKVQAIISTEQQQEQLVATDGDDAQEWLDLLQLLAEYPSITASLRSRIFKLMIRLSRKSGRHPQCLVIQDVEKLGAHPVGGGAFGDVWKGRIRQRLVCLKVMRAFVVSDTQLAVKDYMQEAIIRCQLDHRNLLPFTGLYYLDSEQRQLCLVSPWMEKGNLVQFLKNTPDDSVDHHLLAYDVACGLSYLHGKHIVHGDLKGVNILITPDLRACIGDFGLSRVLASKFSPTETSRSKGTPRWLAPELLQPGPNCYSSKQSDVYAYACVCYEIFVRRIPFHEISDYAVVFAVINRQRPSRPDDCVRLSNSMWNMMVGCWNEVPSSRPPVIHVLARIQAMKGTRELMPAPEWNDPAFKQIWNDADCSPVVQTLGSVAAGDGRSRSPPPYEDEVVRPTSTRAERSEAVPSAPGAPIQRSGSEVRRQNLIHMMLTKEDQYVQDLETAANIFLDTLRNAEPPVISPSQKLEGFVHDVLGNILELLSCHRELLKAIQEQSNKRYVGHNFGVAVSTAVSKFKRLYPDQIGRYSLAERRIKEEMENSPKLGLFLEHIYSNQIVRQGRQESYRVPQLALERLHNRPLEHLYEYPVLLEAILKETPKRDPDASLLKEAIDAMRVLQQLAQLRMFQLATGQGDALKWEWYDLVSMDVRRGMTKEEVKRQSLIFELIEAEMGHVQDLGNIEAIYIRPLRETNKTDQPIIASDRLDQFIADVFHNFQELYAQHQCFVERLHQIQQEQHPRIGSICDIMLDAALKFRDAYIKYLSNYAIAAYTVDSESTTNPRFKKFMNQCSEHPDAYRLDAKNFVARFFPSLPRYRHLLQGILRETPPGHDDQNKIPQVLAVVKSIEEDTESAIISAKRKSTILTIHSRLVFRPGRWTDLDLLGENRSLIHTGSVWRRLQEHIGSDGRHLWALLFDHYLVFTELKKENGKMEYHVECRPIPLELLSLDDFTAPPVLAEQSYPPPNAHNNGQQATNTTQAAPTGSDGSVISLFPCRFRHVCRSGVCYQTVYVESEQARTEWKIKLQEATALRKAARKRNKVFGYELLSTFRVPSSMQYSGDSPISPLDRDDIFTGNVTCSVPFTTGDGRRLVAIGCDEGVWFGFRDSPSSMRRVLHLKLVTHCAVLEFGVFLVLADKTLYAYHLETLAPTLSQNVRTPQTSHRSQRLSGNKDVDYFSVGQLNGRTLVIYMTKKGVDNIFRVLEPIPEKFNEEAWGRPSLGSRMSGIRFNRTEWFRLYREFSLLSESFDAIFIENGVSVFSSQGFEFVDLGNPEPVTLPQWKHEFWKDARLARLAERCKSCRPVGMFKLAYDKFLLCYDIFGLYVDMNGNPSENPKTIEWEGTARRAAIHSPYVLLFDSRFVEIRHLESGKLVQIIGGNGVRCVWDNRLGVDCRGGTEKVDGRRSVPDVHVHLVTRTVPDLMRPGDSVDQVFQLVPRIL